MNDIVLLFFILEDKGKRGEKYNHVWIVENVTKTKNFCMPKILKENN